MEIANWIWKTFITEKNSLLWNMLDDYHLSVIYDNTPGVLSNFLFLDFWM